MRACDFCTLYTGVIPNERRNKIEFWNRYRVLGNYVGGSSEKSVIQNSIPPFFKTSHGDHGPSSLLPPVYNPRDKIWLNTTELRVFFFLHPRVNFLFNVPYVRNITRYNGSVAQYVGIGDPLFLLHYFPTWKDNLDISYRIGIGTGLKIPVGKFADPSEKGIITHIYPSSGSWDPICSLNLYYRYQRWGIFSFFVYRFATANKFSYKFGDSMNAQVQVFYNYQKQTNTAKYNWFPSLGLYYEQNNNDKYKQVLVLTQLQSLYGVIGVDYFFSKFNISFAYQYPIYQNTVITQLGNGGRINLSLQVNLSSQPLLIR